jgi:hypothetical protein
MAGRRSTETAIGITTVIRRPPPTSTITTIAIGTGIVTVIASEAEGVTVKRTATDPGEWHEPFSPRPDEGWKWWLIWVLCRSLSRDVACLG